ncbi:MAG: sodium:alanine symporter family protein [Verrucomicrobia bacterium]|nr:sodium:alanine symporter family protein [Verrucomicrobiota bacterium]MBS0647175.1 sodium:alanine symporter family protein [Verrucomicrobiota bacterium]
MISYINQTITMYVIFPMLVLMGIYLSWKLRFLQFSKLKMSFKQLFERQEDAQGNLSRMQTIASVLAGNFGTGNIAGMAVALTAGGPGSLVWMWVIAFFGSIIQYASCLLAVKYRTQNQRGEYVGGPMYYLSVALGSKTLAILFAVSVLLGAIGVGIFAQMNSMILSMEPLGCPMWLATLLITVTVALIIMGGIKRVAQVSSAVVPVMALLYLGASAVILTLYVRELPQAFFTLIQAALAPSALIGGAFGYSFLQIVSTGLGRALFATDVGTGYVPILQAGAKTQHPVIDGLVSLVAPLLVMIICTVTALVLMVTGAYQVIGLKSAQMVLYAFQQGIGEYAGGLIVAISLFLFGYTTIIAWACCFERAVGYLFNDRFRRSFLWLFIAMIPIGAVLNVDFVWAFADTTLTCMTLCNLIGILGLSREVITESQEFFSERKLPVS